MSFHIVGEKITLGSPQMMIC